MELTQLDNTNIQFNFDLNNIEMPKKIEQLPADLKKLFAKGEQVIINDLPRIVKIESLKHFEESFDNEGFTDKTLKKWAARKTPKSKTARKRSSGRAILVGHKSTTKGTHLKDSFKGAETTKTVTISTNKVYAQVHNEGGKAGRGKGFTMTKRQFMGPSQKLDNKIKAKLNSRMDNVFKG